jgi:hypothetical protein
LSAKEKFHCQKYPRSSSMKLPIRKVAGSRPEVDPFCGERFQWNIPFWEIGAWMVPLFCTASFDEPEKPEVQTISIIKIIDRLQLLKMLEWIQESKLITDLQFGFMPGKSSVHQLCRLMCWTISKLSSVSWLERRI